VAEKDPTRKTSLDRQLGSVVSCPNTIEALTILSEESASPAEIAAVTDMSTSTASYHVKKLVELGMVELLEEHDTGRAIRHVYRATVLPIVSNAEFQKLSFEQRQRLSIWIFQLVLMDAARSFDAALFDAWPSNHLSRTAMLLDQQGSDEVAAIQDKALAAICKVKALSDKRVAAGKGGTVKTVVAALACFEVPKGVKQMKLQEVPSAVPALSIRKSN